MKFRKKPVVIETVQWTGENVDEVLNFGRSGPNPLWGHDFQINTANREVEIETLEGRHIAKVGDWIVRGIQGEFYPCKSDIFYATYEPLKETNQ